MRFVSRQRGFKHTAAQPCVKADWAGISRLERIVPVQEGCLKPRKLVRILLFVVASHLRALRRVILFSGREHTNYE
jgi:hypothetical protein